MSTRIHAYLDYARAFQRRVGYRLASFPGIAVSFFLFFLHAQVCLASFGDGEILGGWRPLDAVRYLAASEALLGFMAPVRFDRARVGSGRLIEGLTGRAPIADLSLTEPPIERVVAEIDRRGLPEGPDPAAGS